MRQIERNMVNAVKNGRNFKSGNTRVNVAKENGVTVIRVYLHENCICELSRNLSGLDSRYFTLAGWNTVTTRSRLNALGVNVTQKNFDPYFDGVRISSRNWYEF